MKISVVIPMYGCRAAVKELYNRIVLSVSKITEDFEIIMVNDSCPQNSWEVIEEICKTDKRVKGIELSRNFGQMKAILAGLDYASGDWIVVMDCDLQDRPEEIEKLYDKAQEGYDVVIARRSERKDAKSKVFLSKMFYGIYRWAINRDYDESLCNFSVVRKTVIEDYCRMREEHRSYIMYLQWLGFRHAVVDVEHNERFEGKSSYTLKKRMNLAFDILTSQSDKLLRLMVKIGAVIAAVSFVAIIVIIIKYLTSNVQTGWSSIVAILFFIGGLIISSIGIVGIYIGNIFMQVKNRPLYVIRTILNGDKEKE